MAKRFIDTDIFKKGFVKSLKSEYKLLWLYLINDCNHAGIWEVEMDVACLRLGIDIIQENAEKTFAEKIVKIDNDKWLIPSFIEFQYGKLNPLNRAHNSVINLLNKYPKAKGHIKGLISPMDKAMDKDKDIYLLNNNNGLPKNYSEVQGYILDKHPTQQNYELCAKIFFDTYQETNWVKANGKQVKNWKNTLNNWVNQKWFDARLAKMKKEGDNLGIGPKRVTI